MARSLVLAVSGRRRARVRCLSRAVLATSELTERALGATSELTAGWTLATSGIAAGGWGSSFPAGPLDLGTGIGSGVGGDVFVSVVGSGIAGDILVSIVGVPVVASGFAKSTVNGVGVLSVESSKRMIARTAAPTDAMPRMRRQPLRGGGASTDGELSVGLSSDRDAGADGVAAGIASSSMITSKSSGAWVLLLALA